MKPNTVGTYKMLVLMPFFGSLVWGQPKEPKPWPKGGPGSTNQWLFLSEEHNTERLIFQVLGVSLDIHAMQSFLFPFHGRSHSALVTSIMRPATADRYRPVSTAVTAKHSKLG